ncbi:type VI secretion system protein TssA [Escherichia coli]|uniref:type VI secretion system protein TssA n=1 Tax=Escherichia coli TaxID=562 RepID=UPI000461144A|nr:type VI secretion system protein TssA [Escherichia coli]EEW3310751.1 type VI secretion system protein TssA [Escherichia coli]EEW7209322.1 type VI secretion system protein TssA [Escherichia coli]EFA7329740.1 type VI secretion system protein TssA [Escherichia coli]EFB1744238.1 type VI secretion system protein TssA [Escherichia coli]EFF3694803.1 type VI secretion system protein TssA [Escherichia coli]
MNKFETDTLLLPVIGESPAGEDIEYDPVYSEIREARQNDPDYMSQGEWAVSEPRRADWRKVRKLCEVTLRNKSKDLQISCWYVESLTQLYSLKGLHCGLEYLAKFISQYWTICWPSHEEGPEIRYSKLVRLDMDLSEYLKSCPLLDDKEITLAEWYKALAFEHGASLSEEGKEKLIESEGDHSVEAFKKSVGKYNTRKISEQFLKFSDLPDKIDEIESFYFFHTHEDIHHIFAKTRHTISEITELLSRFLPQDVQDTNAVSPLSVEPGSRETDRTLPAEQQAFYAALTPSTDKEMTREKAIEQLEKIAIFFRQSEPTSPVPYLLERAVRWSTMTMSEWLEELLKDNDSVEQINRVLKG